MPLGLAMPNYQRNSKGPMQLSGPSRASVPGTPGTYGVQRTPIPRGTGNQPGPEYPSSYPTGMGSSGNQSIPFYPSSQPSYNPQIANSLNTAAGMYGTMDNSAFYQQQMDLIQQMQGAADTSHIQDLMGQLTLAQQQGNVNAWNQSVGQQGYATDQYKQTLDWLRQQMGFNEQGYQLDLSQIEQNRVNQLENAGLSKEQAMAQIQAERNTGLLNYQTGMATAGQQKDYGLGQALQTRDVAQRARRSDATARGATGSAGFGQQWQDIANEYGLETQNINKTYEIRATYETQAWKNIQDKLNKGQELTNKEYDLLVKQANAEAQLQGSAAGLQANQAYAGLQNQWSQENISYASGQSQFGADQQRLQLANQMSDLQYQIQMAQMNNPSAVLGLQMQWNQMNQQLQQAPLANLSNIYAAAQQGLPAPWQPSGPAWKPQFQGF